MQQAPLIHPFLSVGFLSAEYREDGNDVPIYRHASAFLIRENFILSAAHTLVPRNDQQVLTGIRFHLWNRHGSRQVTDWKIHPNYDRTTAPAIFTNDIAVGRLIRGYKFRNDYWPLPLKSLDQQDRLEKRLLCAGYTDTHSGVWYAATDMAPWPRENIDRTWPLFFPPGTTRPTTSGGPVMILREDGFPLVVGVIYGQATINNREWGLAAPILTNPTESFIREFIRNNS